MTETLNSRFLAARRRYIASHFQNLNDMQQQAVLTTEGPLLLLAGAGSGKTTVLINRIANLIRYGCASDSDEIPDTITEADVCFLESLPEPATDEQRQRADDLCALRPAAPWSILAITFTNKAANQLKSRLADMLGDQGQDVWAMTFHAACCRILRREIDRMGYTRSFTIYDTQDSERVMKKILKDMDLDDKTFPVRSVLTVISQEKDHLVHPDEMIRQADASGDLRALHIGKAYQTYQARLKENNALDFDDLILLTVELLQQHEDVRRYYQRKFRYCLVDEYQDTNHLQYLLASLLSGGQENICVVGDDDQSIYHFRGATIENILNFEQQYQTARIIRLEQNYRSTQAILDAANAVIAHNLGRKGKRLWTSNPSGDPITIYEAQDEGEEASFVASSILAASKGRRFQDYAILYRTNAQSNALEYAFKRNGIPYRVIGGSRYFDRAEVRDMTAYLAVVNNPADDYHLSRIVNTPPRGLGPKTMEAVQRLAAAEETSLFHVLSHPESYGPLEKPAGKLREFATLITDLSNLLDSGMSLLDFYEELMIRTGYVAMLESKPSEENRTRLENIRELKSSIYSYVQSADVPTLAGFLEEIALYTDIEQYHESEDAVVMMTMHAAKGLEFPHVFLVGFEDGLFPGMRAIGDTEEMEEERRLCYVAITRAQKSLTISHARQRMLYGRTSAALPSRFLSEIPDHCVVRKGGMRVQSKPSGYNGYYPRPVKTQDAEIRQRIRHSQASSLTGGSHTYLELNKGDMVQHSAFGRGMVLSVKKTGGDALLEIAFDEIGTKMLMAKAASSHMKKLS